MADDHLLAPADAHLPSRAVGYGVSVLVLLAGLAALGAAHVKRTAEADASRAARAVDASTLTEAPMAKYPGGVDARPLDAGRPIGAGPEGAAPGGAPPPASGPPRRGGGPPPKPPERR